MKKCQDFIKSLNKTSERRNQLIKKKMQKRWEINKKYKKRQLIKLQTMKIEVINLILFQQQETNNNLKIKLIKKKRQKIDLQCNFLYILLGDIEKQKKKIKIKYLIQYQYLSIINKYMIFKQSLLSKKYLYIYLYLILIKLNLQNILFQKRYLFMKNQQTMINKENEQKVSNFIKNLINKYNIQEEYEQFSTLIKQKNIEKCLSYVKKKNKQKFTKQITEYFKQKIYQQNTIQYSIFVLLKKYSLQQDDFLSDMNQIKNGNFNNFINLVTKNQRQQLRSQLNKLIKIDQSKNDNQDISKTQDQNQKFHTINQQQQQKTIVHQNETIQQQQSHSSQLSNSSNCNKQNESKNINLYMNGSDKQNIKTLQNLSPSHHPQQLKLSISTQIPKTQLKIQKLDSQEEASSPKLCQQHLNSSHQIANSHMINVIINSQNFTKTYSMKQTQTIQDLKNCIENDYIPKQFQLIQQLKQGSKINLSQKKNNNELLLTLCLPNQNNIQVSISNSAALQFYGFNVNFQQSYEQFNQFVINPYDSLLQTVKNIQFSEKNQQQFSKKLISYISSSIKKGFQIESIIKKIKNLVGKQKPQIDIWVPTNLKKNQKMSQNFILMYLLSNSDHKLRISLMNIIKNYIPIPLYITRFKNIFDQFPTYQLNQDIFWVIKKGVTVCSIGLHSEQQQQNTKQQGKSELLKQIFHIKACLKKNKHRLIENIPYIYINIYEQIFPLNIIDVPRNFRQQQQMLKISDIVIIQSWQNQQKTKQYVKNIQDKYGCKTIVIFRDCQKLQNINKGAGFIKLIHLDGEKQQVQGIITRIRGKICKIIYQWNQNCQFQNKCLIQSKKIFSSFFNQELKQLNSIIDDLQGNNINICQHAKHMLSYTKTNQNGQNQQKMLNENIIKILKFISKCKIPFETILIYLRQRLRNLQKQILKKYNKIYKIKQQLFNKIEIHVKIKKIKSIIKQLPIESHKKQLQQVIQLLQKFDKQNKPKQKQSSKVQENKDIILSKLNKITYQFQNNIKNNIFSIELFWREIYSFMQLNQGYKIGNRDLSSLITQLKSKQIMNNQSFQLIDGDALQMQIGIFRKVFQAINDNCLVISIMGPQSSGKSTLLNFLFGCDFSVSEGRCTRGLYGTYFRLGGKKGSSVLVIDTEGIFAITNSADQNQKQRQNFDSKLVLFCLAISDFTIINVRGNINSSTEQILKACNEKKQVLKLDENKNLQIVMILNQNNTTRTQQSQNQFQSIRKKLNFNIYKSLPQAYQIQLFTQEQILLLGNQQFSIKLPLLSFYLQTQALLNQMVSKINWKHCQNIYQKINYFNVIWETVTSFSNLSRIRSKQWKQLQLKIKQWKKIQQQHIEQQIKNILNKQIKSQDSIDQIKNIWNNYLLKFNSQYNNYEYQQQLKNLIEQQKNKIYLKSIQCIQQFNYQMKKKNIQILIQRQKWEADRELRKKQQEIIKNQNKGLRKYQDCEKQQIFQQFWQNSIKQLKKTIENNQILKNKLGKIKNFYTFLIQMNGNRESQLGLLQDANIQPVITQITQQNIELIQKTLIQKIIKKLNNHKLFMIYTNKPYTNLTKGGKTDAKLKYFSIQNYCQKKIIKNVYSLSKKAIIQNFKIKKFVKKNKEIYQKGKKQFQINKRLFEINQQLQSNFGFCIQNISNCINQNQTSLKKQNFIIKKVQAFKLGDCQSIDNDFIKISLSSLADYNNQQWQLKSSDVIKDEIQKSIKWQEIKKSKNDISYILNNDLRNINGQISINLQMIQKIFQNSQLNKDKKKVQIQHQIFSSIQTINKDLTFDSKYQINNNLNSLQYFDGHKLQQQLRINQYNDQHIIIGIIKQQRLVQKQQFKGYNETSRQIIQKFKNNQQFKQNIFSSMKQYISLFFQQITKIIKNVVTKWNQQVSNKTIQQIFRSVNAEISIFNNDLNQISHQLADKTVGYVHLLVIYLIWKYEVDRELKKQNQIMDEKKKSHSIQKQNFMKRTSNDLNQITSAEVGEFVEIVVKKFKQVINKQKQDIINKKSQEFKKEVKRRQIMSIIDQEIYEYNINKQAFLQYLEKPYVFIQNKYEQKYEKSLNEIIRYFKQKNYQNQVRNSFKQIFQKMMDNNINQNNKKQKELSNQLICNGKRDKQITSENVDQQQCKKLRFKQFINQAVQMEKSMNKKQQKYKQILLMISKDNEIGLKMTDQQKFLQFLQQQTYFSLTPLKKICQFEQPQKIQFKNKVRVNICKQKCPFCYRICDVEEPHQHHKCTFGHQVRALSGNYIQTVKFSPCQAKCHYWRCSNSPCGKQYQHSVHSFKCGYIRNCYEGEKLKSKIIKKPFVQRCEQISQTQQIQFNGRMILWSVLKQQFKQKPGGWDFSDLKQQNSQNNKKFMNLWKRGGPLYCKKHNMEYVDHNDASLIKGKGLQNVHFIFLLDSSGSMQGDRWKILLDAVKYTLKKISGNGQKTKVTIANFNEKARIIFERCEPNKINMNQISFTNGATNFANAFFLVHSVVQKYIQDDKMVILFMSDGQDHYPQQPVNKIKQLMKKYSEKIDYFGIFLGEYSSSKKVLIKIQKELQGKNFYAANFNELMNAYSQCVEIMERKELKNK